MLAVQKRLEKERISHVLGVSSLHKEELGQYFTPYPIAQFMASLFPPTKENITLLDPGAGIGTLSSSFLERIRAEGWPVTSVKVFAYEIDNNLTSTLLNNMKNALNPFPHAEMKVFNTDFLAKTSFEYNWKVHQQYTHVIMNPPYKKISTTSSERQSARAFGLETVNAYTAFLGAAIALTQDKGYIVAIIPRSFCNGLYYKPFREYLLKNCSIKHLHLFESRREAFKDEKVLQENIIIMLQKAGTQEDVTITYSSTPCFQKIEEKSVLFNQIVTHTDPDLYFSIPTTKSKNDCFNNTVSLADLGITVSTGPIVDFRMSEYLRETLTSEDTQLIYPVHLRQYKLDWPKVSKKPNAIKTTNETKKLLFPKGYYVLVKRFSTKEENKRIVASLVTPTDFVTGNMAFENHLNVFHINKSGLPENIALGLIVWLNTSFIDNKFRLFSGHTQVNATDLRKLPYPNYENLHQMGCKTAFFTDWNTSLFDAISNEATHD